MPIYEYRCNDCQQVFENWQSDFEEHEVPCPVCQGCTVRVMSNTSFILKGSGWYVTDYGGRSTAGKSEEKKECSGENVSSESKKSGSSTASSGVSAAEAS